MDIKEIKDHMKANKITYESLSNESGIPLNTLKNIFCGRTPSPRIDTWNAILEALGLKTEETAFSPTPEEMELFNLIREMTEEEVEELSNYLDFILSKRKK